MVLAKPWYHTAIISAKENKFLIQLKFVKKLKMCTLPSSYNYYLTIFKIFQIYHIFSMIIQNRTISLALICTQGQTSEKTHKILISLIALKLQS